jgi:hypothetical protein
MCTIKRKDNADAMDETGGRKANLQTGKHLKADTTIKKLN